MAWQEISPGRYQRPLGDNERFIKFIGERAHPLGREQWSVTATAAFKAEEISQSGVNWSHILREAWKTLRFNHPSIASTASEEALEYLVPGPLQLEEWIAETFLVVDEADTGANAVISNLRPHRSATLHFLPQQWEVILHTAHWRTDGHGAIQLLDALFKAVASVLDNRDSSQPTTLSWGEETIRLVPSVETALGLPEDETPETAAAARNYLATALHVPGTVGVTASGDARTLPRGTRRVRCQLSKTQTEAVLEACRSRGANIFAAVHAAVAATTYQHATVEDRCKHYASTIRFSLRSHLLDPYGNNNSVVASGLYTGGYTARVPPVQTWAENEKQYHAEYEKGLTDAFLQSRRQYASLALGMLQKGMDLPAVSNIDISIVDCADQLATPGVDTRDGRLEITRLGLGVETLTRQPYLFTWIYRGQLEFNLWFNEAYYEDQAGEEILGTLSSILLRELNVE